jgi:hypothetical protein
MVGICLSPPGFVAIGLVGSICGATSFEGSLHLDMQRMRPLAVTCSLGSAASSVEDTEQGQCYSVRALLDGKGLVPKPQASQFSLQKQQEAENRLETNTAASSPYAVDGLVLGGKVLFESEMYRQYHCTRSEFAGLVWCQKQKTERTDRGEVTFSNSILHKQDGTIVYANRYIEPAFFGADDIKGELDRLSAKFGDSPRQQSIPSRDKTPNALIGIWGKIELIQLNTAETSVVASGGSPHKGILVSFLGDLQRSAKLGVPVYRLAGGRDTFGPRPSAQMDEEFCDF